MYHLSFYALWKNIELDLGEDIFLGLFTYVEKTCVEGAEREGRESPSAWGLMQGLNPGTHEIMTWAKIKSRILNRLNPPGVPGGKYF